MKQADISWQGVGRIRDRLEAIVLVWSLALLSCAHAPPTMAGGAPAASPTPSRAAIPVRLADAGTGELLLVATGDILMHETVKAAAAAADRRGPDGGSLNHAGFDALFQEVAPLFAREDAVGFANLESPIAPHADKGTRPFVFNGPPELLAALKAIGFTVLSCANNHAYDQGRAGLVETVGNVREAGLFPLGAGANRTTARAPLVLEDHGLRVGFLAYTALLNDDLNGPDETQPEVSRAEPARMVQEVKALAAQVDAVVVSLHWGTEYALLPEAEQVALAHRLVDAGALVILGAHPHVLQRLERYGMGQRKSLIAYSLGNCLSNQSRFYQPGVDAPSEGDTRDGIALAIRIRRTPAGTEIEGASYRPIWTANNANDREKDPLLPAKIRLIPTEENPSLWKIRAPRYQLRLGGEVKASVAAP
jgi:poly-gamma-glutamate capsule biosynthesis protein CapA/YwtB (metallophosphatase superfamily)